MVTTTRGFTEPMLPFSRLMVKVTLEGQTLTYYIENILNFKHVFESF